jgi:hypothetical protein
MSERGTFPHSRTLLDVSQCRYLMRFRCPRPGRGIPWQSSVKPVAYNSSLLECRIGHVVPIWQPYIGPSSRSWVLQEHPACYAYFKRKVGGKIATRLPQLQYTEVLRRKNQNQTSAGYAHRVGPTNEMLHSLLALDLALRCDAWIGTLTSNWCRLIDEMRATVGCAAGGIYLDAAQSHPPQDLGSP